MLSDGDSNTDHDNSQPEDAIMDDAEEESVDADDAEETTHEALLSVKLEEWRDANEVDRKAIILWGIKELQKNWSGNGPPEVRIIREVRLATFV